VQLTTAASCNQRALTKCLVSRGGVRRGGGRFLWSSINIGRHHARAAETLGGNEWPRVAHTTTVHGLEN